MCFRLYIHTFSCLFCTCSRSNHPDSTLMWATSGNDAAFLWPRQKRKAFSCPHLKKQMWPKYLISNVGLFFGLDVVLSARFGPFLVYLVHSWLKCGIALASFVTQIWQTGPSKCNHSTWFVSRMKVWGVLGVGMIWATAILQCGHQGTNKPNELR